MDTQKISISPEKFELAGSCDVTEKSLPQTKHIGYFGDAWLRFRKNKASIIASVIILAIVLFSVLTPLLIRKKSKSALDSYYAKKGPRVESMSNIPFLDGGKARSFNQRGLIHAYAIALGAINEGNSRLSDIDQTYRTVITPIGEVLASRESNRYEAEIDTYAEVGFTYMQLTREEYENIIEWQEENGLQILYPLVANNEFNPDPRDANYWYRADTQNKNTPIDKDGNAIRLSENMKLSENYERDSSGGLVYSKYAGGNGDKASYRVRVLYRNYYIYLHGAPPSFILGTDSQGYDLALRLAEGIRLSLLIAITVSVINFFIGAFWGAVEGYFGGVPDLILERISDILSCIPFIVVATLFQLHLSDRVGKIPSLLFAFVLTGWISIAARVRTQFYRFKKQDYVLAARTLGASSLRIILKHIFPNALGTIITSSVLIIPTVILNESMLSFLGIVNLGSADTTSLGTLLSEASNIWTNYPHLMIIPALVISLLMICFNLFGNGLRDALNPSLRGVDE